MTNDRLVTFLRDEEPGCELVIAVCTGSLVPAAAGLLRGYECTTHGTALHRISAYGAKPVSRRVVFDRKRMTGGGVTAGIDLGLVVAARLCGEDVARKIQLQMEYASEPPFEGCPDTVDAVAVAALQVVPPAIAKRMKENDATAFARLATTGAENQYSLHG